MQKDVAKICVQVHSRLHQREKNDEKEELRWMDPRIAQFVAQDSTTYIAGQVLCPPDGGVMSLYSGFLQGIKSR